MNPRSDRPASYRSRRRSRTGILGSSSDPLFVSADPSAVDFRPFATAEKQDDRLERRRSLLADVDARRRRLDSARGFGEHERRALDLVTSAKARRAFDLSEEPTRLRDRYEWSPFGQGCLLARRLVEAGVGLVTANWARDDALRDSTSSHRPPAPAARPTRPARGVAGSLSWSLADVGTPRLIAARVPGIPCVGRLTGGNEQGPANSPGPCRCIAAASARALPAHRRRAEPIAG